jgi:YesN/AraC family two-component response regulator
MVAINRLKDIANEIITSNLIVTLLSELLIQTTTSEAAIFNVPDFIKATMKYIDQNFHTVITLDELGKHLGISKFYLSKEFKKYTGMTIGEYILSCRLAYAKELLKYSKLSIQEITYRCGMNQVSHFIQLFKKHEGTTPLAYRKEWQL